MKKTYNLVIWMLASLIYAGENSNVEPKKPKNTSSKVDDKEAKEDEVPEGDQKPKHRKPKKNTSSKVDDKKEEKANQEDKKDDVPAKHVKNLRDDIKLPFDLKSALENPGTEIQIAIDLVKKLLSKNNKKSVYTNVQMYGLIEQIKQRLIPFIVPEDVMQKIMEGMKGSNEEETRELVQSVRQIINQYPEINNLSITFLASIAYLLNSNYVIYYGFDSYDTSLNTEENIALQKNIDTISAWVIKIIDAKTAEYGRSLSKNSYNEENDQNSYVNDKNDQNENNSDEVIAEEQGAEDEQ